MSVYDEPGNAAAAGRPLRVLVITPQMRPGGAEMLVVRLSRQLVRLGQSVCVASSGGELVAQLPPAVRHVELPLDQKTFSLSRRNRRRLATVIRDVAPDVVHAQSPLAALAVRLSLLFDRGAPRNQGPDSSLALVATVHGLRGRDYPLARWLLPLLANVVIAVSARTAEQLGGRRGGWVHVIPVCVETERASAAAPAVVETVGRAPLVIGSVGRLEPEKGHAHLLRAFALLAKERPGVRLHLVGDGIDRPRLEQTARDLGVADRVTFLGYRSDVDACLREMDLFVLPSLREGMPLALLEAMSSGLPVVATEVGGVPEVLGDAGILVTPGDDAALAEAIREMVDDPERRRAAAAAARAGAAPYSCAEMARRYLAVYRQALARMRPGLDP